MRTLAMALSATLLMPVGAIAKTPASLPTQPVESIGRFVGPAVYVTDLDRSIAFYRDLIGMKVRLRFGTAPRQDAMVGFGTDTTQPSILLISDKEGATPRPVQHGHGYDRLVLFINDLPGLATRLRAAGLTPTDPKDAHGTSMVMWVSDPDGYKLELIGAKPRG